MTDKELTQSILSLGLGEAFKIIDPSTIDNEVTRTNWIKTRKQVVEFLLDLDITLDDIFDYQDVSHIDDYDEIDDDLFGEEDFGESIDEEL